MEIKVFKTVRKLMEYTNISMIFLDFFFVQKEQTRMTLGIIFAIVLS
jgi:hypothetical protein